MPETLLDIQNQLLKIFTDPRGPQKLLEDSPELCAFVEGQKGATTLQRVSVYADAYFLRIKEVLENDFELTHKYLGPDQFHDLVVSYLRHHHPSKPNAQWLGFHLPDFVADHSQWSSDTTLVNLLRMEWMITEVVFAPYEEAIALDKLSALSAEEFSSSVFEVDSTHKLLRSPELIEDFWIERISESLNFEVIAKNIEKPWLLIRRKREGPISFYRMNEGEALLWEHLAQGKKLSQICEDLSEQEELVAGAMGELGRWIQLGLIKDIK